MPVRIPTSVRRRARRVPVYSTYEQQPGSVTGHLPGSVQATAAQRAEFEALPESSWMNDQGRDAIYSALYPQSRLLETLPMQGFYRAPTGLELNPGRATGVTVEASGSPMRAGQIPQVDREAIEAAEAVRGYVDAQNAAAAHGIFPGGRGRSMFVPATGRMNPLQMEAIQGAGARRGLGDIVDTGRGVTVTSFWPPAGPRAAFAAKSVPEAVQRATRGRAGFEVRRGTPSGTYEDYTEAWQKGPGSGAATRQMLERVGANPQVREMLNSSADIGQKALDRAARDESWVSRWGATREDLQNARAIIGQGPGWVDRLEQAVKAGAFLPSVAAGIITMASGQSQPDEG